MFLYHIQINCIRFRIQKKLVGDEPTNLRNMLLLVCNLNCGHYSMLHVFLSQLNHRFSFLQKKSFGATPQGFRKAECYVRVFFFFWDGWNPAIPERPERVVKSTGLQRTSRFLFPQVEKVSALRPKKWRQDIPENSTEGSGRIQGFSQNWHQGEQSPLWGWVKTHDYHILGNQHPL